jgi:hypothetical protein
MPAVFAARCLQIAHACSGVCSVRSALESALFAALWEPALFAALWSLLCSQRSGVCSVRSALELALFTALWSLLCSQRSGVCSVRSALESALFAALWSLLCSQRSGACSVRSPSRSLLCSQDLALNTSHYRHSLLFPFLGLQSCNRSVYVDAHTGVSHDYCGRSHAQQATGGALAAPHGNCHLCQLDGCDESVYYEESTDRVHEYCSRFHADQALNRGERSVSNRSTQGFSGAMQCSLPGCSAQRWTDPSTGHVHDYCGRTHAKQSAAMGLVAPPSDLHGQVRYTRTRWNNRDIQMVVNEGVA